MASPFLFFFQESRGKRARTIVNREPTNLRPAIEKFKFFHVPFLFVTHPFRASTKNQNQTRKQYKSIADDRTREIAKLEEQIISLEANLDPQTSSLDAMRIKLAEAEGTMAALQLELTCVRGKLDKKTKNTSDASSWNALNKLAHLAGQSGDSSFHIRDYFLGLATGVALVGLVAGVHHHNNQSNGSSSLAWIGEISSSLFKKKE